MSHTLDHDCELVELDNGLWWCQAPGCDDDRKRLLPKKARRRCRSPERNAAVARRLQAVEANLTICQACPLDQWDDENQYCRRHSSDACKFNRLLQNPSFECDQWPKIEEAI